MTKPLLQLVKNESPQEVPLDIETGLAALAAISLEDHLLGSRLELVAHLAKRSIPAVGQASVTLIQNGRAWSAAYTGDLALELDQLQYEKGSGPSMAAAETGRTFLIRDTGQSQHYGQYARGAQRRGIASVASVGMPIPQGTMGALNLYFGTPTSLRADTLRAAQTFAAYGAIAIANAALSENAKATADEMQTAIRARETIEQAKGMLMIRHDCTAGEAFGLLSSKARQSNSAVGETAAQLLAQHGQPRRADPL